MNKKSEQQLHQVNGVLEKAFFLPLYFNDWLGFHFNLPFLFGLAPDELQDLFIRCALADKRLNPDKKLPPLARLLLSEDPAGLLAQALASLKEERPFLLHRILNQLPALTEGELNPDEFEDLESLLEEALPAGPGLSRSAKQEIKTLRGQASALLEPANSQKIRKEVTRLLSSPALADIQNESQLRLWLSSGSGAIGLDPDLLPQVLIEVWSAWTGAVTGAKPDMDLMIACRPSLRISDDMLENYLPPVPRKRLKLAAACPYCQQANTIKMDEKKISATRRCPHLIFIGTSDPLHLLRTLILAPAEIGEDVINLLDSYYNSPSDHDIFATFIYDLYQRLLNQERLKEVSVNSMPSGQPYASLLAYFAPAPVRQAE
jgi:hypothetical protein